MTDIAHTLKERGNRYGDFREHARVAQALKMEAMNTTNWELMPAYMREGFDMILHKMARALSGDWTYVDNLHDMVGYAKLMEDRMILDNNNPDVPSPTIIDPFNPEPETLAALLRNMGALVVFPEDPVQETHITPLNDRGDK